MRLEFYGCLTGRLKQTTDEKEITVFFIIIITSCTLPLSHLECSVLSFVSRCRSLMWIATFRLQTASLLQAMLSTFDGSRCKTRCSAGCDQEKRKQQESHMVADTWAVVSTFQNNENQNALITVVEKPAHHRRTSFSFYLFQDKQNAMETSGFTLSDDIVMKTIIL